MQPYPNGQFRLIDHPDRQSGNGSVWTRTCTQSDGPEPLLTLIQPGGITCVQGLFRKPAQRQKSTLSQDTLGSPELRKQIAKPIKWERAADQAQGENEYTPQR